MSRTDRLLLPRQLYMEMLDQARSERPNECCGILAGVMEEGGIRRVVQRYPLVNEAASPIEYRAESHSLLQAHKDCRRLGYEVLAIYHSHPTSAPIPSPTDLERSYSDDIVSLIISLQGDEPSMRGWWLLETHYEEALWQIIEP